VDRFCVKFECPHWHFGSIKCSTVIMYKNFLTVRNIFFSSVRDRTGSTVLVGTAKQSIPAEQVTV
jgi:hypothetical protein